jgi:hypothetical protein
MNEMNTNKKDNINPSHYKDTTSIECIDAMILVLGKSGTLEYCKGAAFKYLWRFKNKNGLEDLKKAQWYISKGFDLTQKDDETLNTLYEMVNVYEGKLLKENEKWG